MPLAGVVTLIGVGIVVVVLALSLTEVALRLKHVNFTLGTIIAGLRSIANQTEPLRPVMDEINKDLADVQATLEGLLAKKAAAGPRRASSGGAGEPAPKKTTRRKSTGRTGAAT